MLVDKIDSLYIVTLVDKVEPRNAKTIPIGELCILHSIWCSVSIAYGTKCCIYRNPPTIIVSVLGALLLLNATLLAVTALRWQHMPALIMFFVVGDIGWVVLTIGCLALGLWIQGTSAILASITIATIVGALGYCQYLSGVKGKLSRQASV